MPLTAIFDIGKTNKKFILFDDMYKEVFKAYVRFDELLDEDGFPCDDLKAITAWIFECLEQATEQGFEIGQVNFSTYGASFVYVDHAGNPLTPLYNYLKPFPDDLLAHFYGQYGPTEELALATASPPMGMLNSGLQLYWLKHAKPAVFANVRWALHFPQYLSFLLTGVPFSDFTSIGCHTGLWDFQKNDYHDWVRAEGLDRILPPIAETHHSVNTQYNDKKMAVGVGIHDSSSAMIPYLKANKKPFLLISTGTWSIGLNPFCEDALTKEDLKNDCLNFLRTDGLPVRASRLFLGYEFEQQVTMLESHFGLPKGFHREVVYDHRLFEKLQGNFRPRFVFNAIQLPREQPAITDLSDLITFETAYHQLMLELVELQVAAAKRAIGKTPVESIYIDGGFADNDLFVQMLTRAFPLMKIRITQSPLGSALGAVMIIRDGK